MPLSPRLQKAAAAIRELACDGAVECSAEDLGRALGLSARRARQAVTELADAGVVARESKRGSFVRVVFSDALRRTDAPDAPDGEQRTQRTLRTPSTSTVQVQETKAAAQQQLLRESEATDATDAPDGGNGRSGRSDEIEVTFRGSPFLIARLLDITGAIGTRVSHENGNGHRDLKPENVLIATPDEEIAFRERCAQGQDKGDPVTNPVRMKQLVVEDCRRDPGVLAAYLNSAQDRKKRDEIKRVEAERTKIAHEKFLAAERALMSKPWRPGES